MNPRRLWTTCLIGLLLAPGCRDEELPGGEGGDPNCSPDGLCNSDCRWEDDLDCVVLGCLSDTYCNRLCPTGTDPDCGTLDCSLDLTCNPLCGEADPDCREPSCALDGLCYPDCGDTDPDCAIECAADGLCDPGCPADPDCPGSCALDGACNALCEGLGVVDPDCGTGECGQLEQRCCGGLACVGGLACGEVEGGAYCLPRCSLQPCQLAGGEAVGSCVTLNEVGVSICYSELVSPTGCGLYESGCLTNYGVSSNTICLPLSGGRNTCFEMCDAGAAGCELGELCMPSLIDASLGACVPYSDW